MGNGLKSLVAAALLLSAPAVAGPKEDVLAASDAFMAALNSNNPDAAEALTHPSLTIQILRFPPEGGSIFSTLTRQQLFDNFRKAPPRKFEEYLVKPRISLTRDFAHVWGPYTLDIDGKRIHCGIDSFGWSKIDGKWLLTSFAWTADPKGCPPK